MSDIFISYASADRPKAEALAQVLKAQGWTVWWDRTIPAGRTFDEVTEEALDAAKSVIVLWSEKSAKSSWVRTEAHKGADRNILIPVSIEEVRIPIAFRRIQAADLIGWDGSDTASSFQELVGDIEALLGPPPKTEEKRQQAEAEARRKAEEARQQGETEAKRKDVGASEQIEVIPTSEPTSDAPDHSEPTGIKIDEVKAGKTRTGVKNSNLGGDIIAGDIIVAGPVSKDEVQFTAYYPTEVKPELWYTLLAYVHVQNIQSAVHRDSQTRLGQQASDYRKEHRKPTENIARGTEIVVIPRLLGCRFNPPKASVLWIEDWHRLEFRMQASEREPGFQRDSAANGRLSFYVGPILVAEITLWAHFSDEASSVNLDNPETNCTADTYRAVFVSYSHRDSCIVDQLENAYVALGMKYLRDVQVLRSGEKWNPALLKKIEEAELFQLCWSDAAKQSSYVEQEWRHAFGLRRQFFIRPVYWQTPMPDPPPELSDIHFAYFDSTA